MTKSVLEIVDQSLEHWVENGINSTPGEVPPDMFTGKTAGDWTFWKPIDSRVTNTEISAFENDLGFDLPVELAEILKHKHFVELHIGEVEIFSMPSTGWQHSISRGLYDTWPREYVIDKGYFPFANFSDWGMWCFNLNETLDKGKYPVYLWDHDDPENFQYVASSLGSALNAELDKNAKHEYFKTLFSLKESKAKEFFYRNSEIFCWGSAEDIIFHIQEYYSSLSPSNLEKLVIEDKRFSPENEMFLIQEMVPSLEILFARFSSGNSDLAFYVETKEKIAQLVEEYGQVFNNYFPRVVDLPDLMNTPGREIDRMIQKLYPLERSGLIRRLFGSKK